MKPAFFLALALLGPSHALQHRQYQATDGPSKGPYPLTDENIRSAVQLWHNTNDQTLIEGLYGGPIANWNTSAVTSLEEAFLGLDDFEADLSQWDVSRVTNMRACFYNTSGFKGNVGKWDVSKVQDMRVLLSYSSDFQDDLSHWNTKSLQNLRAAFTEYYNTGHREETLPISFWETPNLLDMEGVFAGTVDFKTDLTGWDTSRVTSLAFMLEKTVNFSGGDLSKLDTSSVVTMEGMFQSAVNVRSARKISDWDTSKVQKMDQIFYNTTVTSDEDTPDDAHIFFLCWDLTALEADTLSEAFCYGAAGGFDCDCVADHVVQSINSACIDSKQNKHCYGSLGEGEKDTFSQEPAQNPVDLFGYSSAARGSWLLSLCAAVAVACSTMLL